MIEFASFDAQSSNLRLKVILLNENTSETEMKKLAMFSREKISLRACETCPTGWIYRIRVPLDV